MKPCKTASIYIFDEQKNPFEAQNVYKTTPNAWAIRQNFINPTPETSFNCGVLVNINSY